MPSRTFRALGAAAIALLAAAAALPAQERVEVRRETGSRAWLGFTFRSENGGTPVIVERVLPGSPAERGGLAAGDTVVQIDGHAATDRAMEEMRTGLKPGDRVQLTVRHAGAQAQRTVVAATRPGRDVVIVGPTIRIQEDGHADPIILQLDSLGGLQNGQMRHLLDSLGIDVRAMREMGQMNARQFRMRIDTLQRGRMRVHMDSLHRHLDSLSFRMDSLRVHLRHMVPDGVPLDGDYVVVGPGGERIRQGVRIRGNATMVGPGERTPFFLDLGRRALGGAELVDLNDKLGSYFSSRQGALVLQVSPGTPAARAGLEPGDVVVRAGEQSVSNVAELRRVLNRDEDGRLSLQVLRHGRRHNLQLQWDRAADERAMVVRSRERQQVELRARQRAGERQRVEVRQRQKTDEMDLNDELDDDAFELP